MALLKGPLATALEGAAAEDSALAFETMGLLLAAVPATACWLGLALVGAMPVIALAMVLAAAPALDYLPTEAVPGSDLAMEAVAGHALALASVAEQALGPAPL